MANVSMKLNQELSRFFVEPIVILLIVILTAAILLVPNITRPDNILPGTESYFHLRIANTILEEKGIIGFDDLSYGGRLILTPIGWPLSLALSSFISNASLLQISKILPFILGLISIVLFYLILKKLQLPKEIRIVAALALIISPAFIYLFTTSNWYTLPVLLNLLAFYLFLFDQKIITTVILFFVSAFGILNSLIGLLLLLVYILVTKKTALKWFFITLLLVIISLTYQHLPLITNTDLLRTQILEKPETYHQLISDLGGRISLSIFAIILSILGILTTWKKKYTYTVLHLTAICLTILVFFFVPVILYLNLLLSIITSFGVIRIIKRKWESKLIKNFTVLILILGLIFSGLSHINETKEILPNKPIIDGLEYIKEHTKEDEVVLSHYSNGIWINTVAGRKNIIDENFKYAPKLNQRLSDVNTIFYSRGIENTTKIIDRYEITYIFITPNMKNGLVWTEEEQGLLFILEFSKNFKKIYDKDSVEVWKVIKL